MTEEHRADEPATSESCPSGMTAENCCQETSCQTSITLHDAWQQFELEAVPGRFDTGRYHCRYFSWGRGPALLLVPGLAEAAESFVLFCARLASHFRCIAYDLADGKGDGAALRSYTHADLVADALKLLDHLGIEQSYVVGSSFGSTIALAALHQHPGRLLRGVLVGGFARRRLAPAEVALAWMARWWPGRMRHLPLRQPLMRRSHGPIFATRESEIWDFFVKQSGAPSISAMAHRALMLHALDLRPVLSEIRQPILMVCGDCDPLVGTGCEAELLQGLPNVVRAEFEHCGHFPQFTHPELLAEVVKGFLTQRTCTAH